MSNEKKTTVLSLKGVAFFFACGHGYVMAVADSSPSVTETRLVCPRCGASECPQCTGVFSGHWLDFCSLCEKFFNFTAWVDYAVTVGARRIRCQRGVIIIPTDGEAEEFAPSPIFSPWPHLMTLGDGDIELEGTTDSDGVCVVYALANIKVRDQVNGHGKPDESRIGHKMAWTVCRIESAGVGPDDVLPPEPFDDFSQLHYADEEKEN